MRRQRRMHHAEQVTSDVRYNSLNGISDDADDILQMDEIRKPLNRQAQGHRFENTIEAKVEEGDTLQALALRFHCTVADIKRLNKIDKDNEIHARKIVKIPVTVHTVLLGTLPAVHTSGSSSPKHAREEEVNIIRNPLEDAQNVLGEKLMVASVNAAGNEAISRISNSHIPSVNSIILNSKLAAGKTVYTDDETARPSIGNVDINDASQPLISDIMDDECIPHLRQIPGPPTLAIDWSGSDCDMSWICLFVVILALCFVIPLVYVFYVAEHQHHHNSTAH